MVETLATPSGGRRTVRPVRRLRELSEAECYARCYGSGDDQVRVVKIPERRRPRYAPAVSGEELRRLFELRLDARQPEAA
jgi:hypothetical protein